MDPALLNRCNAIEVPVPSTEAKEEIFQVHTRKLDLDDGVDLGILAAEMEDDYTGRDIKQVVRQAAVNSLERTKDASEAEVQTEDFMTAIQELREGNIGMEKDFLSEEQTPREMFA
jgi:proteasome regulatory subunit